ncbi:dimethyl sulfoxide reductase anchor subunit family protein [Minwuia sp.]|uniref:dimethyl sulfoxide reductase anchor subunit family protein n=1 Tax=Minwuia sp. TaxID=2493630 RepID=UPI003A8D09E5
MHPAFSLILFTTLSGAGFGALTAAWLTGRFLGIDGLQITAILGFLMAGFGLLNSLLHLRSPARARFALSQWRTSWLSREGVLAIVTMLLAFVLIVASFLREDPFARDYDAWRFAGIALAIISMVTVRATGMIYQSIAAVPSWAKQPTSLIFLLFAATGGGMIALAAAGDASNMGYGVVLFFLFTVWYFKVTVWGRIDRMAPTATIGSATGLGDNDVRLFERPHVTENWLTKEMGFRVARRHAMKLRLVAVIAGGLLPAAIIALPLFDVAPHWLCWLAVPIHLAGVMVERWLFFAEAKHVQMLFYGEQAV